MFYLFLNWFLIRSKTTDSSTINFATDNFTPTCSKQSESTRMLGSSSQNTPGNVKAANNSPSTTTNCTKASNTLPPTQSKISSTTEDYNHPCYLINPEKRHYIQCIANHSGDISKSEFVKLLEWFFDKFRTCDNSHTLQFMHQSAVTHYDGKVWIACMNEETCDWVSTVLSHYNFCPYKVQSLNADSHYCEVVIPTVATKVHNLLDIFNLLEKQNPKLSTLQWCVTNRRTLSAEEEDYSAKAASSFCTNELLNIWIDGKSKEFLNDVKHTLKYCFWQIVFKFVNN